MFRLRFLCGPDAPAFADKTFPAYGRALLRCAPGGPVWALGAWDGEGRPCGLALAVSDASGEAELLSLLVDAPQRRRGLGRALLRRLEAVLAESGAGRLHTSWSEGLDGAAAFAGLLAAGGWTPPQRLQLLLSMDWSSERARELLTRRYARYRESPRLPQGYACRLWRDMTPEQEAFIRSRKNLPAWHTDRNDPFRERRAVEPLNSLLLLHRGEPAGWVANHRIAPDTIRYTDLFVRTDLARSGVGIAMGVHSYWLQAESDVPRMTMAMYAGDERHVRLLARRMVPAGARLRWSWRSGKALRAETAG